MGVHYVPKGKNLGNRDISPDFAPRQNSDHHVQVLTVEGKVKRWAVAKKSFGLMCFLGCTPPAPGPDGIYATPERLTIVYSVQYEQTWVRQLERSWLYSWQTSASFHVLSFHCSGIATWLRGCMYDNIMHVPCQNICNRFKWFDRVDSVVQATTCSTKKWSQLSVLNIIVPRMFIPGSSN